jgi:hypothetical protein
MSNATHQTPETVYFCGLGTGTLESYARNGWSFTIETDGRVVPVARSKDDRGRPTMTLADALATATYLALSGY